MTTICCVCHKTKSTKGWVKRYVARNKKLSHGYCPDCYRQAMGVVRHDFRAPGMRLRHV